MLTKTVTVVRTPLSVDQVITYIHGLTPLSVNVAVASSASLSAQTHCIFLRSARVTASAVALLISHHIAPPRTLRKYGGTLPSRRRYLNEQNTINAHSWFRLTSA